jgi:hypothetical protein
VITTTTTIIDDYGNTCSDAYVVDNNTIIDGSLESPEDYDFFMMQVLSSGTVTVYTKGTTDTYGFLKDSNCIDLETDDDDGEGTNFSISRTVNTGTYYVAVRSASPVTGVYTLHIEFTPITTSTTTMVSSTTTTTVEPTTTTTVEPTITTTVAPTTTSISSGSTTTTSIGGGTTTTIPVTTTAPATTTTAPVATTTTTTIRGKLCPAKKALGEDNPQLENLRIFRDSKLANSAVGRRIISIYYNNADSINAALERSPALKAFTRRVLEVIAPLVGKKE